MDISTDGVIFIHLSSSTLHSANVPLSTKLSIRSISNILRWKRLKYFYFGAEQAEGFKEMFHPAIIPTSVLITPVFI